MEPSVVVKVFRLLEALGEAGAAGQPLGVLADVVSLPKPTSHRLLKTMVELGYVEHGEKGVYRLTARVGQLGRPPEDRRLLAAAEPALGDLHARTGETVNLGLLRLDKVVYLRVLESTHPLRRIAEPQSADPFYCTAMGRVIAAHLPMARQDLLLSRKGPFRRRTVQTVVSPEALRDLLIEVRGAGYAIERDQTDVGVTCIGAPIFDGPEGDVVAAISLSVPSARADAARERKLISLVRAAASAVTAALARDEVPVNPALALGSRPGPAPVARPSRRASRPSPPRGRAIGIS